MNFLNLLQKRHEEVEKIRTEIETLKDRIIDLESDLEGAEVIIGDKSAVILDVDWVEKEVLLHHENGDMSWISFS